MEGVILAPRGSRAWPSEGWAWRDTRELAAGSPGCQAHGQEQSGPGRDQARGSLRGAVSPTGPGCGSDSREVSLQVETCRRE